MTISLFFSLFKWIHCGAIHKTAFWTVRCNYSENAKNYAELIIIDHKFSFRWNFDSVDFTRKMEKLNKMKYRYHQLVLTYCLTKNNCSTFSFTHAKMAWHYHWNRNNAKQHQTIATKCHRDEMRVKHEKKNISTCIMKIVLKMIIHL